MKNNTPALITLAIVILFGLMTVAYYLTNGGGDRLHKETMSVRKTDQTKWSKENKKLLVEYSDLQCPACKSFHELLNSFESTASADHEITKNVTLVYRHFPLYQIHPHAYETAYAAEAAGKQGAFFKFADAVYADQDNLSSTKNIGEYLRQKTKSLGLNIDTFSKDMTDQTVKDKVGADLTEGESMGIDATPTFFLNGKRLEFTTIREFVELLKAP